MFKSDLVSHLASLRRYATALTGRLSEADDLVQDCIERALRQQDSLQHRDRMGAWLRSILHNLFLDAERRRRRFVLVDIENIGNDLACSAPPEDRAGVRDFIRALASLSVEHRQILLLVGVEGMGYREVADELQIPIGTVMSRLARARDRLRIALAGAESAPAYASAQIIPIASKAGGLRT